jgi:hypothetical protein
MQNKSHNLIWKQDKQFSLHLMNPFLSKPKVQLLE